MPGKVASGDCSREMTLVSTPSHFSPCGSTLMVERATCSEMVCIGWYTGSPSFVALMGFKIG